MDMGARTVQIGDGMYESDLLVRRRMSADWRVRTADPREADLFTWRVHSFDCAGNVGAMEEVLERQMTYIRVHYPFWDGGTHQSGGVSGGRPVEYGYHGGAGKGWGWARPGGGSGGGADRHFYVSVQDRGVQNALPPDLRDAIMVTQFAYNARTHRRYPHPAPSAPLPTPTASHTPRLHPPAQDPLHRFWGRFSSFSPPRDIGVAPECDMDVSAEKTFGSGLSPHPAPRERRYLLTFVGACRHLPPTMPPVPCEPALRSRRLIQAGVSLPALWSVSLPAFPRR